MALPILPNSNMTGKCSFTFYKKSAQPVSYSVEFNCYWVTIKRIDRRTGKETDVVFKRDPMSGGWLDGDHQKIANALSLLEDSIFEAIKEDLESAIQR